MSNENTAQWDILNCPCGIILVLEQMCVYQPWSVLISKRFLHRIENIFVCICKNEKKKNNPRDQKSNRKMFILLIISILSFIFNTLIK